MMTMVAFGQGLNTKADEIVGTYLTDRGGSKSKVRVTKQADGTYDARVIWVENPYDENGNVRKVLGYYTTPGANGSVLTYYNPLYNASLGTKNFSKYTEIVENFYIMAKALAFDSNAALQANTSLMPIIGGRIVEIAFTLILGTICVASAIAFGIGGREAATAFLKNWTEKFRK